MKPSVLGLHQRKLVKHMIVVKPSGLKIGDVVCFARRDGLRVVANRFPFGDHEVHREVDGGFFLRRAYMFDGEAKYEESFWPKDSNFEFVLLER